MMIDCMAQRLAVYSMAATPMQPEATPASPLPASTIIGGRALSAIPRMDINDPALLQRLAHSLPVVITGSALVTSLLKWTPDYLAASSPTDTMWAVYRSRDYNFRYWHDSKRAPAARNMAEAEAADQPPVAMPNTDNDAKYVFTPPTRVMDLTFAQFLERLRSGDGAARYYLQAKLTQTVGTQLMSDFAHVAWNDVLTMKLNHGWGPLTTNMLLVGQAGNTTPAHFDEQVNTIAQHGVRAIVYLIYDLSDVGLIGEYIDSVGWYEANHAVCT